MMVKHRIKKLSFLVATLMLVAAPAMAQINLNGQTYIAKYKGISTGGSMCTNKMQPKLEAKNLLTQSIEVNLDDFKDEVVNRVSDWGDNTSSAIMTLSTVLSNDLSNMTAELVKAKEAGMTAEQKMRMEEKTLEAVQSMTPSPAEKDITIGLAMYRPDLAMGARQSEMNRYINELNNVPLDDKFKNTTTGMPLPGYVDSSQGSITAMGQEFRNFVRFFCDARSINGKLASTRFLEYNKATKTVSQYWCGQDRGLADPPVQQDARGQYIPLEGAALLSHVKRVVTLEKQEAAIGRGKAYLVNAPKNVADLYFEPHTLNQDKDIYDKAEQQFARFVIGRASDVNNTADFATGEGQRAFMQQQARTAKLALARYPFAEMFSKKAPTMPSGSAAWAAGLIEANIGDCTKPKAEYASLCALTKQLRMKDKISESEFFDVLFNRQFQGMAFSQKMVGMTEGQLKRMQVNLQGLQLALNYQRNRLKEQQVALMAAIYAQQNK